LFSLALFHADELFWLVVVHHVDEIQLRSI
jgi:hypothetical protein